MSVTASIIIPSRAGAQRLPRLFAALKAQDNPHWEAIAVLDGDIDNSIRAVETAADSRITAIVFPENRGRVSALNAGFNVATGDVLIRCDDDLVPQENYVSAHIAAHQDGPCGVIGLCVNKFPANHYARVYGDNADKRFFATAYETAEKHPQKIWRYWGGNVSVTREVYQKVGPYDSHYRAYGWEDVDYGYRLQAAGIPVRIIPALETSHYAAAVTTKIRVQRAYHSGAARIIFEKLHGDNHLPAASASPTGVWEHAVYRLAAHTRLPGFTKLSAAVDQAIRLAPAPIGQKMVALLVEAAAIAGYHHPENLDTNL